MEEKAFAKIGSVIASGEPAARRALNGSLRRAKNDVTKIPSDAKFLRDLVALHETTLAKTSSEVDRLLAETARMSLASIRDELRLCERTLAPKHTGAANTACDAIKDRLPDLITEAKAAYLDATKGATPAFRGDTKKQMLLAKQYGEPPEKLDDRLFSPTPLSLRGNGGRGIWHRTASWTNESARASSVGLMNIIRMAAMMKMNEVTSA